MQMRITPRDVSSPRLGPVALKPQLSQPQLTDWAIQKEQLFSQIEELEQARRKSEETWKETVREKEAEIAWLKLEGGDFKNRLDAATKAYESVVD